MSSRNVFIFAMVTLVMACGRENSPPAPSHPASGPGPQEQAVAQAATIWIQAMRACSVRPSKENARALDAIIARPEQAKTECDWIHDAGNEWVASGRKWETEENVSLEIPKPHVETADQTKVDIFLTLSRSDGSREPFQIVLVFKKTEKGWRLINRIFERIKTPPPI